MFIQSPAAPVVPAVVWPILRPFQQLPAHVGIKRRKMREDFTEFGTSVAHHDARFSESERVVRNKQSHDVLIKSEPVLRSRIRLLQPLTECLGTKPRPSRTFLGQL